jgi:hypothetical protein
VNNPEDAKAFILEHWKQSPQSRSGSA